MTDDLRAAVVLKIDEPGFQDFRADAECQIRLQSVIGEKLVECQPTQPRPEGEQPPPPLTKIPDGEDGAGQRLLPVEQTLTPVGEDLIRGVMRRPYRERFAIILNEFGAGLAGRGKDLRKVIRGANPTLRAARQGARRSWPTRTACWPTARGRAIACWPSGPRSARTSPT